MRRARIIRIVVPLVLLALVVGGCRKELSTPLMEQTVEGYYRDAMRVDVQADCPEHVEMRTSNHFFCRFTYGTPDREGWVVVLQNDGYGSVTFYPTDPVDHAKLEATIEAWLDRTYDLDLDVRCPDDVVPLDGFNFECRAGDRRVRVRQVQGNVDFTFHLVGTNPGDET